METNIAGLALAVPFIVWMAYAPFGIPRHSSKNIPATGNWSGNYNIFWRDCWNKAYDRASEKEFAEMAPTFTKEMRRLFRKRVFDVAAAFGDVVDSWDVVNESSKDWTRYHKSRTGLPVWKSVYGLMPGDYPLYALLDAKEAFPADARLAINDYNICPDFLAQVKDLDAEGSKIDIVGCQMHLFNTNDCMRLALGETGISWISTPADIRNRLDMMAKTGRPLHVSEVTITSPGADDRSRMIQAVLKLRMNAMFSVRFSSGAERMSITIVGAETLASGTTESSVSGIETMKPSVPSAMACRTASSVSSTRVRTSRTSHGELSPYLSFR